MSSVAVSRPAGRGRPWRGSARAVGVLRAFSDADAEGELRKPVERFARDEPLGGAEGLGHRAVGEEGDEGALQQLLVARIGLDGLAEEGRRGRGVARRAGDIGGEEIAFEAVRRAR